MRSGAFTKYHFTSTQALSQAPPIQISLLFQKLKPMVVEHEFSVVGGISAVSHKDYDSPPKDPNGANKLALL